MGDFCLIMFILVILIEEISHITMSYLYWPRAEWNLVWLQLFCSVNCVLFQLCLIKCVFQIVKFTQHRHSLITQGLRQSQYFRGRMRNLIVRLQVNWSVHFSSLISPVHLLHRISSSDMEWTSFLQEEGGLRLSASSPYETCKKTGEKRDCVLTACILENPPVESLERRKKGRVS